MRTNLANSRKQLKSQPVKQEKYHNLAHRILQIKYYKLTRFRVGLEKSWFAKYNLVKFKFK